MKSKINQLATGLCAGALGVSSWTRRIVPAASDMSAAAKTGVVGTMLLAQSLAVAESNGLLTGITNATTGVKALIGLIAVVGVLAGLAFATKETSLIVLPIDYSIDVSISEELGTETVAA